MRKQPVRRSDIYIMSAYHLREETTVVTLKDMANDGLGHKKFILFGRRDNGKSHLPGEWPAAACLSYGHGAEVYEVGKTITYTLDTGMGHRCRGYGFHVTGWVKVNEDGSLGESRGEVPGLSDRVNSYVFK